MKYILTLLLLISIGCNSNTTIDAYDTKDEILGNKIYVVEFDGCEYVFFHGGHRGYFSHKGNCKYCRKD